ncbi:MAG TPA: hypothetical protein O0W80_01865, partial [Methanocorpusculum sp.]|nr:hypothetical protein [Methanocorpusculum sp.]
GEVIVFRHVNVEIPVGFLIVADVACIFFHFIAPYMLNFLRYIHSRGKRHFRVFCLDVLPITCGNIASAYPGSNPNKKKKKKMG